jgi:hypothetical protein
MARATDQRAAFRWVFAAARDPSGFLDGERNHFDALQGRSLDERRHVPRHSSALERDFQRPGEDAVLRGCIEGDSP